MSATNVKLTDPAYEFSVLAERLKGHNNDDGRAVYVNLAEFIGVHQDSVTLFELIGYVGSRSVSLLDFISSLKDEFMDESLRSELTDIVVNISQLLSPRLMGAGWAQAVEQHLIKSQILSLRQFSQTARRHRPLKLVTEAEREKLLADIEEALQETSEDLDIPDWALAPLREGLRRLKVMIIHFDFFGHEAVLDHLMKISGEASMMSRAMEVIGAVGQNKLFKTAAVIASAVSILLAPINAGEVYSGYRGYVLQIIENPPPLLNAPPRMLEAPKPSPAAEQEPNSEQMDV